MGLIDLKTDLKSLRYGKDRLGGGSSNQPYIKSEIPTNEGDLGSTGGPDFLLRGGLLTPGRITKDTSRLTQMFFDFKSPNGLLFTAKQNVLSRTSVPANGAGKALNNGVYLPTSTLLGAAGNPIGLHLNKQGIDPFKGLGASGNGVFGLFGAEDPLGQPYYKDIVKKDSKSRLENYLDIHISKQSTGNLYEYSGGPGSILGIGTTKIPLLNPNERTGVNNPNLNFTPSKVTWSSQINFSQASNFQRNPVNGKFNFNFNSNPPVSTSTFTFGSTLNNQNNTSYTPSKFLYQTPLTLREEGKEYENLIKNDQFLRVGASPLYAGNNFILSGDIEKIKSAFQSDGKVYNPPSVYVDGSLKSNTLVDRGNTLTQEELAGKESSKNNPKVGENLLNKSGYSKTDYLTKNLEQRVKLGNPGKKEKVDTEALDKINSRSIYRTSDNNPDVPGTNDLVKFRIGVIDNNSPEFKTNIHFRAFIDNFIDSYSSDWQAQKFMGRGENFYRYNGFDRSISLSWTVAAQSREELIPMYKKLNYLASVCAPDYSSKGYMRGNLVKLTIGGYLYEQVGIMKGITYTIPQESPWEIALPYGSAENTGTLGVASDNSVKELSHMIKVTGFEFIPIHDFIPSVQKNDYYGENNSVSKYGPQRYIALDNGDGPSNYGI